MSATPAPGPFARVAPRRRRRITPELLARSVVLAALAAWAILLAAQVSGRITVLVEQTETLAILGPLTLLVVTLVWRPHSPLWLKRALAFAIALGGGLLCVVHIADNLFAALVPVGLLAAGAFALRFRVLPFFLIAALAAGPLTIETFTPINTGPVGDVMIAGAWMALVWRWLTGTEKTPAWLPLALIPLVVYVGVSLLYVVLSDTTMQSVWSFRASCWYMTIVLLLALTTDKIRVRDGLQRAFLVVAFAGMVYAMVRWAIGPAAKEDALVRVSGGYVLTDTGDLRLFGAQLGPQALGTWSAVVVPFALASSLSPIGFFWRLMGLATAVMGGLAIYAADSRSTMVAAGAGLAAVLVLFAASRGFTGNKALPLVAAMMLAVAGTAAFITIKLDAEGSSATRFEGIFDPLSDYSVQDRLVKWRTILDGVDDMPFGHGLGASGAAEEKYAEFTSAASFGPDSSYVKVAYDQGFPVALLFIVAILTLIAGLTVRALAATDAVVAGLAVGATGSMLAFAIVMTALVVFEGVGAATPWLIAGLGFGATSAASPDSS